MTKPDWAMNPAIWEKSKTNVRRQYGIHTGARFTELVQAEYLKLGGSINRAKLKSFNEDDLLKDLVDEYEATAVPMLKSAPALVKSGEQEMFCKGCQFVAITRVDPVDPCWRFQYGSTDDTTAPEMQLTKSGEPCFYQVVVRRVVSVDGRLGLVPIDQMEIFEKSKETLVQTLKEKGYEEGGDQ